MLSLSPIEKLENKKTLLAVSGGIDSVVMCYFFQKHRLNFAIAHCNFQLRGKEADADENFVSQLAQNMQVKIFVERFETEKYAKANKLSIQMAARKLRYDFFEEVRVKHNFDFVATAHQANDDFETLLINIKRSKKPEKWKGIPQQNGHIIRPMLHISRAAILEFAKESNIIWREDASNAKTTYLRNRIRHIEIPEILANPEKRQQIEKLKQEGLAAQKQLKDIQSVLGFPIPLGKKVEIPFKKITSFALPSLALRHLLDGHGFHPNTIQAMERAMHDDAAKTFVSDTTKITLDRGVIYIEPNIESTPQTYWLDISQKGKIVLPHYTLNWQLENAENLHMQRDKTSAYFPLDKLQSTLQLRTWQPGDKMKPFGMKGKKKVSDILIDDKVALHKKDEILVLKNGEDIIWVLEHRTSEDYKVESKTNRVLIMKIEENA